MSYVVYLTDTTNDTRAISVYGINYFPRKVRYKKNAKDIVATAKLHNVQTAFLPEKEYLQRQRQPPLVIPKPASLSDDILKIAAEHGADWPNLITANYSISVRCGNCRVFFCANNKLSDISWEGGTGDPSQTIKNMQAVTAINNFLKSKYCP